MPVMGLLYLYILCSYNMVYIYQAVIVWVCALVTPGNSDKSTLAYVGLQKRYYNKYLHKSQIHGEDHVRG
jgi:hypothetical protein